MSLKTMRWQSEWAVVRLRPQSITVVTAADASSLLVATDEVIE